MRNYYTFRELMRHAAYPILAWVVIALAILATLYLPGWLRPSRVVSEPAAETQAPQLPLPLRIQGKTMVNMAEVNPDAKETLWEQISTLNSGPVLQRQWFVVMAGELAPDKALTYCKGLSIQIAQNLFVVTEEEKEIQYMLDKIYVAKEDPASFSEKEKKMLAPLDWFGRLALAGKESPERAAVMAEAKLLGTAVSVGPMLFIVLLIGGLIGLIAAFKYTRRRLAPSQIEAGFYTETFAAWMVLFLILQIVGGFIGSRFFPSCTLLVIGICTLLSLSALLWTKHRSEGSWHDIRQDIGLTFGQNLFSEVLVGLGGYAMALPFMVAGLLVTALLAKLLGVEMQAPLGAAHPIAVMAMHASLWTVIQIFFVACVVAPIVEETFFRGALYRSIRSALEIRGFSARSAILWSTSGSIVASGMLAAFIFAIVHPQGLIAVPVLMAMAWNFTLLREWRGSLIPGMVTHGISNAVTLSIVILMAAQ